MKIFVICFFIISIGSLNLFAQEEVVNDTILLLTHKEKGKTKFIKDGKKIKYWKTEDGSKNKGKLEVIKENSVIIDGVEYQFEDLIQLRAKSTGLKIIQSTGKVVLATGTVITSFGAYLIIYAYSYTDPNNDSCNEGCGDAILIVGGIMAVGAGLIIVTVGSVPLAFTGKKFDFEKWDIQMEIVPDKKATRKLKRQNKKEAKEALAQPEF